MKEILRCLREKFPDTHVGAKLSDDDRNIVLFYAIVRDGETSHLAYYSMPLTSVKKITDVEETSSLIAEGINKEFSQLQGNQSP